MTQTAIRTETRDIVVEAVLPHRPDKVWAVLTTGELMKRWMMEPTGFAAEVGTNFSFQTTPAGAWDGTIRCRVLEVIEGEKLAYSWKGGDAANAGYGSALDTVVTFTLKPTANGTHVKMVHSGFELPKNEVAFTNMGKGWHTVMERVETVAQDVAG